MLGGAAAGKVWLLTQVTQMSKSLITEVRPKRVQTNSRMIWMPRVFGRSVEVWRGLTETESIGRQVLILERENGVDQISQKTLIHKRSTMDVVRTVSRRFA